MAIWYVRPDTTHSGTRNGTSYATAWGGWDEINAGSMAATDTLYVCGSHSYSAVKAFPKAGTDTNNRFTVSGDYQADTGSIAFTGSSYLNANQNHAVIKSLSITSAASTCIFMAASKSNIKIDSCTLAGYTSDVNFAASTGATHTGHEIIACSLSGAKTIASINLFVTATGATVTLTGLTVRGCTFTNVTGTEYVIHLRSESDTTNCVFSNIDIDQNTFSGCSGNNILVSHDGAVSSVGGRVDITDNDFLNTSTYLNRGGVQVSGCTPVYYTGNTMDQCVGNGGGFNIFYASFFLAELNTIKNLSSDNIDGNGFLVDHGNGSGIIRRNTVENCTGKVGATNSGCGVMILDSNNISVYGNTFKNCRIGAYFGFNTGSNCVVAHNDFVDCSVYGVYLSATTNRANITFKNNICTGLVPFVYDASSGWTLEDYNCVYGMTASTNHTDGANNITADPQFIPNSYKLKGSSPCKGTGAINTYTVGKHDFNGHRFNPSAPDRGAYKARQRTTITDRSI